MENNKQEELQEEVNENASEEVEETIEEAIEEATEAKDSSEVDEKDKKVEELTDTLQRLQAEYANYRRRTQQEKETMGIFANEKILNELIPVMDNMERAMDACTDKEDSMYKGLDMVQKQLKATFEKFGLEEIDAEGQEFDPNLHLAVMQEPVEGIDANQVVMVLQKGYKLKTKVLRPAMVKVSC
ncbi:protein grpE (HSP-70 cofactor([[Clostridium] sordellii]|uniref:Protein GrpE n=1 Tax=Paraclostridium sordellii TaxID=1505 RepID=A0ABM9RKS8_PARSO|nr:nucleotide exchange factor GrpE [Paeniclostridium sordellii]EPZ55638.1 protein grpE [[Clostridium] sordellii ATCC 9714] [Paeniclostridium sordellii ATCC 9714]CEJ72608.1 Protein grpE (HSP-70 cofactor) [[Clostridium] sordellii] [Paeniclostridium sordellii]CEN68161.1 protein grpE (HSP-70 cofactor) [[Clostridium] sordellii] [Paeniclostridium sordellii]CEN71428.1 protein grpE (HSP-70 cofactor) [[Clostridium] sordellii] [Paeniclostridium sordellii]CEO21335.1 protein grpE (HSP-70 cofactor) [[Clost